MSSIGGNGMTDKERLIYATAYRSLTKVAAEISNNSEDQKRFEIIDWLIEQAEKAEKYREALEQIANSDGWLIELNPLCTFDGGYGRCVEIARQALEE